LEGELQSADRRQWVGFLAPAVLYGLLAWRIATVRSGAWVLLGIACAVLACLGHVNVWRWARRTSDRPLPVGWIAVYVASILAIIVVLGRASH
jgi:hypothetical protein